MGPKGIGRTRDCQSHRTLVHGPCTGATRTPIFKHEPRRGPRDSAKGGAWLALPGICLLRRMPTSSPHSCWAPWRPLPPGSPGPSKAALPCLASPQWPQLGDPTFFQAWASLFTLSGGWVAPAWNTRAAKQSPRVTQSCLSLPALPQMQTIY